MLNIQIGASDVQSGQHQKSNVIYSAPFGDGGQSLALERPGPTSGPGAMSAFAS